MTSRSMPAIVAVESPLFPRAVPFSLPRLPPFCAGAFFHRKRLPVVGRCPLSANPSGLHASAEWLPQGKLKSAAYLLLRVMQLEVTGVPGKLSSLSCRTTTFVWLFGC
jgi:hypothetical protein